MVNSKKSCWCNDVVIPAELTVLIPTQLQQKSYICEACINLFNENSNHFKDKYSLERCPTHLIDM